MASLILAMSERGAGRPVVLLHGLFGRAQNFGTLSRHLSRNFKVVLLDLRNHGESPHGDGMSYQAMADDVINTLEARGVPPAAMLGHSMGGKVAMVAALSRPDRITRLVVADIAPVAYRHSNTAVAAAMLSLDLVPGLTRAAAAAHLADTVPDPAVRGFLLQNLILGEHPAWRIGLAEIAADMALIEGFPALPAAARYEAPALFLRGEHSGYVKDAAWPVVQALFPAARLETLAGAGHWLHADQPEAFARSVEAFLTE